MREQLLGYLLGALEPSETALVEARLSEDPQLRRELETVRASLAPLDEAEEESEALDPPPGLASRTFQLVRSHAGWSAVGQATGAAGAWRAPDYMIAAGIFLAASMLVFPAIHNSRIGARLTACQDKLRLLGVALSQYGQANGYLPFVPATGRFAAAGMYAPILQDSGLLDRSCTVLCPDSPMATHCDFHIPTIAELEKASPEQLRRYHRIMGGAYAYHPGHIENRRYVPTPNRSREYFAVMADAADELGADRSPNHRKIGQNVLCQSGRVVFIIIPQLWDEGDNIYINDFGVKGAGVGEDDSSLCNSAVPPILVPVMLGP
ncbi:MAG: hypothetical protein HYX69_00115 [Planctomycetia bacterium]|nr:hypothetical protein [Planctomycetia bacterium]